MTCTLTIAMLLALLAAVWQWRDATAADARADRASAALAAEQGARLKEHEARAEENRRIHILQEALDAEHISRLALEDDVRRADTAAVGLRERARQLAAAARCAPSRAEAAAGGPAAEAPGDLLADMLDRLDERAGELARYADQARIAGSLCERAYDALTPTEGRTEEP